MKLKAALVLLTIVMAAPSAFAYNIDYNGFSIPFGNSWDSPSNELDQILQDMAGGSTLYLMNGESTDPSISPTESWYGTGTVTVILQEIAGYRDRTTFGWYEVGNISNNGELFSGPQGPGTTNSKTFDPATTFGFYIDPNGYPSKRLYTESALNGTAGYDQVMIFRIGDSNEFILGWEDLFLGGRSDADYQDMIVKATINAAPVPEPATLILLGSGLAGLGLFRSRKHV